MEALLQGYCEDDKEEEKEEKASRETQPGFRKKSDDNTQFRAGDLSAFSPKRRRGGELLQPAAADALDSEDEDFDPQRDLHFNHTAPSRPPFKPPVCTPPGPSILRADENQSSIAARQSRFPFGDNKRPRDAMKAGTQTHMTRASQRVSAAFIPPQLKGRKNVITEDNRM
eukprot:GHVT01077816.1.p1 GENE.GHVT01077816.1~~GHVT01077816.1.p1  ORF type:complete len:170 (-),score=42.01 GHVT01077816.1:859-1368(-)